MTARRKFLIGMSAVVNVPAIVRAASMITSRGIVTPLGNDNYYGFSDRLWIKCRYENGELRGRALSRMTEQRILQVPPALLAYDLSRWGTGDLSVVARKQRRQALWPSVKNVQYFIRSSTQRNATMISECQPQS